MAAIAIDTLPFLIQKCPEMSYVSRKDASSQLLFAIHILVERQEAMPTSITGTKRFEYTHLID